MDQAYAATEATMTMTFNDAQLRNLTLDERIRYGLPIPAEMVEALRDQATLDKIEDAHEEGYDAGYAAGVKAAKRDLIDAISRHEL